ncbi:MAG: ABC transporter substrate-binding protein, partial [Peptococcaceae bacterium]|nr:ABC transporter substrate-binding protein [Peptococcaceae bacterium]
MKFQSIKKFTALFLTLLLLLVFTGCSPASEPPADTADGNQAETFTITDQAGRTVEIPNNVESVAMTWGPAANFVLALGKGDIISAFNYSGEFAAKVSPNLANVSSVGKGKPDMEALAKLKPDVFIHKANDTATLEAVQDLGIPAVGIYSETQDDLLVATELVGKVLGAEEQATKLINFYNEKINFAADLVKDIPADERKTVIVMGSEIGKVANGTMLQSFLIETAGGINLAKDIVSEETWPTVGTEQIFSWDPDYIFCVNSSQATY